MKRLPFVYQMNTVQKYVAHQGVERLEISSPSHDMFTTTIREPIVKDRKSWIYNIL